MKLPTIAPQYLGTGLSTGLEHRFRYVARLSNNSGGRNGNSWIVTSLPYLHYSDNTVDDMPDEVIMMGMGGAQWEWVTGTGYVGRYGTRRRLEESGGDFRVFSPDGAVSTFVGPSADAGVRGRIANSVNAQGIDTVVSYDSNQRIASEVRTDPETGNQAGLHYEFAADGAHAGKILSVEKRLTISGVAHATYRWTFTYHDGTDSAGSLNDLKTAKESVWDSSQNDWADAGKRYFRYYKTDSGIGFVHGLRYVLEADGYDRMTALGLDPEDVSQVTDEVLAGFAAEYYEYDASRRHSKVVIRAGTQSTTIARLDSDGDPARNWKRREIATRPDASTLTTYFDTADRPVLKILASGGDAWPEYWEYDSGNRETLHATPNAIDSVSEPANASQDFSVTLKTAEGLIETRDYYPDSGGGAGSAPGYLKLTSVKEGSSGFAIKQRELTYTSRTVGGDTIYRIADSTTYRDSAGGGTAPATTGNAYTWRGSTFAVLQHTVNLPVVSTGENGTGATVTRVTVFDDFGNAQWIKTERGRIDYIVHDRLTGSVTVRIDDANTAELTGVPSGWSTVTGFGSNRRTDCQSDLLGRATRILGPVHSVPTKTTGVAEVAVPTRRTEFAAYLDGTREIRSARGGSTGSGCHTLGTVSLRRIDFAGNEIESIGAARTCECGPLSASEAFPQSSWRGWRREFFNAAGYLDESRVWHAIPSTGEGFVNANFYPTRLGRDAMGRENREVAPGGTITRTVFDSRGLPLTHWMGTDDVGATDSDPTGGGATGNNMVVVTVNEYDDDTDGGNGNLTATIRPVDGNSANDRRDDFDYDFRDRLVRSSQSDGSHNYLTQFTLDNLGAVVQTDRYHTNVASGNLTTRSTVAFDARGKLFESKNYSVDPDTGAVGGALVAERWHDDAGNVIKETYAGSEGFVKRTFDAFNRERFAFTACNPGGGSDNNDPASDTVVEQSELDYDAAGNLLQRTAWQRFHDATGTGALNSPAGPQPKGRRTFVCWWRDAIGREVATADYGTNGGAPLIRPEIPPSSSDTVLVTRTRYASTGNPGASIDPQGTETRWKRDALGREIETVENFREDAGPAADVNRTSRFCYHPSGGLETLTLVNEVTGDQTTRWVYGTTLADSAVATGHLLRAKIYPESDDSAAPLGDGPDGVYERIEHTYNRQGEIVTTKDPNETVHAYDRDTLGRLVHDRVTAFGAGIDQTVKRISLAYDAKRPNLVTRIASHDDATPGSGSILNEVGHTYDGLGQLMKDQQSHSGAVNPGTTPEVAYAHATP